MKKFMLLVLFMLISLAFLTADIIPSGYRYVPRYVKIANCSQFPEYSVVGVISQITQNGALKLVELQDNMVMDKGYKFNGFQIYALKKSFITASGGLTAIDFDTIKTTIPPADIVDPAPFTVKDSSPLASETVIYKIAGVVNNKLVLYVAEYTLAYRNGQPSETRYFSYTLPAN